jgi:hypothetical protein
MPPADNAVAAMPTPTTNTIASQITPENLKVCSLLYIFGVAALGEGDLIAGANTLAAMACAIANVQRPGSRIEDEDGTGVAVGTSVLVSGGLSTSVIAEKIVSGLGSRQNNYVALRLDRPVDHERFRNDLLHDRRRLTHPMGFNGEMVPVPKAAYVSGSLAPAQWDDALVAAVVDHGLPILFLPHGAKEALTVKEDPFEFSMIANMFAAGCPPGPWGGPLPALPDMPPFTDCQAALRSRLRHFPADYEFFILRTLREFGAVAARVASFVAGPRTSEDERSALQSDLHLTGVRAVALGVESLVYHGYGFEAGCPRDVLAGMLRFIRGKGSVAKRDVQRRFQSLDAARRDSLLEQLAAQGLVTLTGRSVTAVALADFVAALPSRPGFGEVGLNCAGFPGMRSGGVGVK